MKPGGVCKVSITIETPDGQLNTITFNKAADFKTDVDWHRPEDEFMFGDTPLVVSSWSYMKEFSLSFRPLKDEDGISYTFSRKEPE